MLTCATGCNVFDTERKKLAPTARCRYRVFSETQKFSKDLEGADSGFSYAVHKRSCFDFARLRVIRPESDACIRVH
jgi:hypothetical protein